MDLNVFKDAKIAAGKSGMTNEIKSVSVLEAFELSDLDVLNCQKTEILLTGFLGARKEVDRQCQIVKKVAEKGCAALVVFFVGDIVKKIDGKVLKTADEEGLPLIIMPKGIGYSEAISEIMDRVLYGDNFRNSLISNTVFHLLNFEKHSNFQSAVREAAMSFR